MNGLPDDDPYAELLAQIRKPAKPPVDSKSEEDPNQVDWNTASADELPVGVIRDEWGTGTATYGRATPGRLATRDAMRAYARKEAARRGLDPDFVDRIFKLESNYNPRAVSPKGAKGIGQLVTGTARRYGVKDPFDPQSNIDASLSYIEDLSKMFGGDQRLIASGYFSGEGRARQALADPKRNPLTAKYVATVAGKASSDPYAGVLTDIRKGTPSASQQGTSQPDSSNPYAGILADLAPDASQQTQAPTLQPPQERPAAATSGAQESLLTQAIDTVDRMGKEAKAAVQSQAEREPVGPPLELTDIRRPDDTQLYSSEPTIKRDARGRVLTWDGFPAPRQSDGRINTEITVTVTSPDLNNGRPTNIPSLWGGKRLSAKEATERAVESGIQFPSFDSTDEAIKAAQQRSKAKDTALREPAKQVGQLQPQQPVEVTGGAPMSEDDLYREWYKARQARDFETQNLIAQNYLEQFPKGKYAQAVASGQKIAQPITDQEGTHRGAGAYIPVKDIEDMRRKGMKDSQILKAIQDNVARQMGLSDSDVAALTQKYGRHPLSNIVEPGTDSASSVNSIIRQGKSNAGLAEFHIQPETIQTILGDHPTFNPMAMLEAQAQQRTHSTGAKEFLETLANDKDVLNQNPEIALAGQYLAKSPEALKLLAAITSGGLESAAGVARTEANIASIVGLGDRLKANADELGDMAENVARQSGEDYKGVKHYTKTLLDLFPILLAAETGGTLGAAAGVAEETGTAVGLAAYGYAEQAHQGPKQAIINATMLAAPYAVMAKSGLAPLAEEWIAMKLGPTPEMGQAALAAGTKQEAINEASKLLTRKLVAEKIGATAGQAINLGQFIATSAAVEGALQGKRMTAQEIADQALLFGGFAVIGLAPGAIEIPGEVRAKKAAVEEAAFGKSVPAEGRVVEPEQITRGAEPPAPESVPHEVRPPSAGPVIEVRPEPVRKGGEEVAKREEAPIYGEAGPPSGAYRGERAGARDVAKGGEVSGVRDRERAKEAQKAVGAPELQVGDIVTHPKFATDHPMRVDSVEGDVANVTRLDNGKNLQISLTSKVAKELEIQRKEEPVSKIGFG